MAVPADSRADLTAPKFAAPRLRWIISRYGSHIEADFAHYYPGTDPIELWQRRRWRRLQNLIDHLPRASYYSQAVASDPEYAEMLRKANEEIGDSQPVKKYHPPMAGWTEEAALLADLLDAVKHLTWVTITANSSGKGPPAPEPTPRPFNAFQVKTHEDRLDAHKALAARMLPHKYPQGQTEPG